MVVQSARIQDLKGACVKIIGYSGKVVGTGFYITEELICTCVHVVKIAQESQSSSNNSLVEIISDEKNFNSEILVFDDDKDIAILKSNRIQSEGALILGTSVDIDGHSFSSFGFPELGSISGIHFRGVITGKTTDKKGSVYLQLNSQEFAHGMAGSPILDLNTNLIVGMVALTVDSRGTQQKRDTAFGIPTEIIQQVHPQILVRQMGGGKRKTTKLINKKNNQRDNISNQRFDQNEYEQEKKEQRFSDAIKSLKDNNSNVRQAAVEELAILDDKKAVPYLNEIAVRDKYESVRNAAVKALNSINVKQVSALQPQEMYDGQIPSDLIKTPKSDFINARQIRDVRQAILLRSGVTKVEVHFSGEPPTLVPWSLEVDALVIPVGTSGSLTGKMATGFLDALGEQRQYFLSKNELYFQLYKQTPSEVKDCILPETPIILKVKQTSPNIKPRNIILATAFRRPLRAEHEINRQDYDESQDIPDVFSAGDAAEAIMRLASENHLMSVAIPLLGTGEAGLPSIDVAKEMLAAISNHIKGSSIQQVILLTRDWGAYSSLVEMVRNRPQKTLNDISARDDRLKIKAEMDALADTLLLTETETPLAVGVLGGWGTGKSFALYMLHQRMIEIRTMAASSDYVGHPYLIDFDAWTYAKSNLWSSLMQTIFIGLNSQLEIERNGLQDQGEHPFEEIRKIFLGTKSLPIGTEEALWKQIREIRCEEINNLQQREAQLLIKRRVLEAQEEKIIEDVDNSIKTEIEKAKWNPLKNILYNSFLNWYEFITFVLFAVVAILVPTILQWPKEFQVLGMVSAAGSIIIEVFRIFERWKVEVRQARTQIIGTRAKRIEEGLEDQKNDLIIIEEDIRTLQIQITEARRLAGVTGMFNSLLELCQARLKEADYENQLGLMHRVKLDLDELNWVMKETPKSGDGTQVNYFPRGKPRIILFIDDLDRCPPNRVVEVLEATQLLLKTDLFVVIIAMDVRYVKRALEKVYEGILAGQGHPSGLDYIEKIIQIPYQIRPIGTNVLNDYISSMMTVEANDSQPPALPNIGLSTSYYPLNNQEESFVDDKPEKQVTVMPPDVRKLRTLSMLSQVITFSKVEHDFLVLCCQKIDLTPRSVKRLVNVCKLLKILWSREPQWPQPDEPTEQAIVLLLALSCAYPDAMREAFNCLADEIRNNNLPTSKNNSISIFFDSHLISENKSCMEEWRRLQLDLHNLWVNKQNDMKLTKLKELPISEMRNVLDLIRSFSFVGDLGYEPGLQLAPISKTKKN